MLRVFDDEELNKIKIKIDYIPKLSCFKEDDFIIYEELMKVYNALADYHKSQTIIADIYNIFDDINIWDIDDMDADGLDLIIDIFDMIGYMIMGDIWDDDDELWYSTMMDFFISSVYREDDDYMTQKKEILYSLTKIISFLKSIIIYKNICMYVKGDNNVSENESKN